MRSVTGEKYDRMVGYKLKGKPPYREPGWEDPGDGNDSEAAYAWAGEGDVPF